jgi:hypothetical protein
MKQLSAEQLDKQRTKQRESAKRSALKQQQKQREKWADPEHRAQVFQKAVESAKKRHARVSSPEYRAEQAEKARKKQEEKAAAPPAVKARSTPIRSRGSKGRTPTAAERRVMDALGKLPCIACLKNGKETVEISLHHIDGRTKPDAHKLVLPLCKWHHQHAAPDEWRAEYSWLVPVHACGTVGGRAEFEAANGTEYELLRESYTRAGIEYDIQN